MGLATTLSRALFFFAYLSLLRMLERRNYDAAGKYGLLSHAACLADDTSSIWWLSDFDRQTSLQLAYKMAAIQLWAKFSLSCVILVCGDISSSPGLVSTQGRTGLSVLYFNACSQVNKTAFLESQLTL